MCKPNQTFPHHGRGTMPSCSSRFILRKGQKLHKKRLEEKVEEDPGLQPDEEEEEEVIYKEEKVCRGP